MLRSEIFSSIASNALLISSTEKFFCRKAMMTATVWDHFLETGLPFLCRIKKSVSRVSFSSALLNAVTKEVNDRQV